MRTARLLAVITAVSTLALSACGGPGAGTGTAGTPSAPTTAGAGFPVTVRHAFGTTTVASKPLRVATVAWANHEVPLALGIVPVGMSRAAWGDDDGDGVLPWVEDRLEALGAATPTLFDETDGIDVEAVAATKPDLILAAYSGLTREQYDTLSRIAPTVAYPELAWGTSVQELIRVESRALGMAEAGEKLVTALDAQVAARFAAHPQLKGRSVVFTYLDPTDHSTLGFYTSHDTRPGFLTSLGMRTPRLVQERSAATRAFSDTVSAEQADRLADADVLVTYGNPDGSTLGRLQADRLLGAIPAIARGSVAVLRDSSPLAASANPTPLSVAWGIDDYFALLAAAAARA